MNECVRDKGGDKGLGLVRKQELQELQERIVTEEEKVKR